MPKVKSVKQVGKGGKDFGSIKSHRSKLSLRGDVHQGGKNVGHAKNPGRKSY